MASKPDDITRPTAHVKWDRDVPAACPVCNSTLRHQFNDGGRRVETLKGPLWVVTNYYKCMNEHCKLHEAFPAANQMVLTRKKFGLDVWSKVIQHRFKHKMNYTQTEMVMWDDWQVSMSQGAIKAICEFFEATAKAEVDEETLALVREAGGIVLSLDGAKPKNDRPAFWVFTDRQTGRILLSRFLEKASADILVGIFKEIEELYGVPIIAVISDKQKSIVNAVKKFNPDIPHVYCQFHFLHHVREPIASKDSHLLTVLRSTVKSLSIVINRPQATSPQSAGITVVAQVFAPIAEELLCAVNTRGDRFKVYPGLEAYANLEYLLQRLEGFLDLDLASRLKRSLEALVARLDTLLEENQQLASEIASLAMDFAELRAILKHRSWSGKKIKKKVGAWQYKLQSRLKRRDEEYKPGNLKWERPSYNMELVAAWQQWVRLVDSYDAGLYHAYDDPLLEHTNNPKEGLFSRTKHHFRSSYGRDDIQEEFERHADSLVRLLDYDYETAHIKEVLLATDTALVDAYRADLRAYYVTTRRRWRIREEDTGNIARFESNLANAMGC